MNDLCEVVYLDRLMPGILRDKTVDYKFKYAPISIDKIVPYVD